MEKPLNCTDDYNLRVINEDQNLMILCLFAHGRDDILNLITALDGKESSGTCPNHEEYHEWWMNQPAFPRPSPEQVKSDLLHDDYLKQYKL